MSSGNERLIVPGVLPCLRVACNFAPVAGHNTTQLNKWLQLEPFPDNSFRNAIMLVLVLDIVAAFLWDRLMLLVFAPRILWASVEGTTWNDLVNALKVVGICYTVIYFLATVSSMLLVFLGEGKGLFFCRGKS